MTAQQPGEQQDPRRRTGSEQGERDPLEGAGGRRVARRRPDHREREEDRVDPVRGDQRGHDAPHHADDHDGRHQPGRCAQRDQHHHGEAAHDGAACPGDRTIGDVTCPRDHDHVERQQQPPRVGVGKPGHGPPGPDGRDEGQGDHVEHGLRAGQGIPAAADDTAREQREDQRCDEPAGEHHDGERPGAGQRTRVGAPEGRGRDRQGGDARRSRRAAGGPRSAGRPSQRRRDERHEHHGGPDTSARQRGDESEDAGQRGERPRPAQRGERRDDGGQQAQEVRRRQLRGDDDQHHEGRDGEQTGEEQTASRRVHAAQPDQTRPSAHGQGQRPRRGLTG